MIWNFPDKLKIVQDKVKGRCIVANVDIEEGELIFRETPYCYILFKEYSNFMCDYCFRYFTDKSQFKECNKCEKVKYCSEKCMEESKTIHDIECSILCSNIIEEIATNIGVTYDRTFLLLRFVIKVLSQLTLNKDKKSESSSKIEYLIPNYNQICNLEDNISKFPKDTLEVYRELSNSIINIQQINEKIEKYNISNELNSDVLLKILCIIDSNSFGIPTFSLLNEKTVNDNNKKYVFNQKIEFTPNNSLELAFSLLNPNITGWGLFSYSSLLNHSCDPNCSFIGVNNDLNLTDSDNHIGVFIDLRANKRIKKNEEINISYVELYESRRNRIKTLFETKHFLCQCNRCSIEFYYSKDSYIDGFLCLRCFSNCENNNECPILFSKSLSESFEMKNLPSIVDDSEYLISQLTSSYECIKCKRTFFGCEITNVINEFTNIISEAERLNNEACDLLSAIDLLTNLVNKYLYNRDTEMKVIPHPTNYLLYKCYKLIAFWSIALGKWDNVDKYISFMINSHNFALENNTNNLDTSNLYSTKAVALYNSNKVTESEIEWSKCKSIRRVCCGTEHPLYFLIPQY